MDENVMVCVLIVWVSINFIIGHKFTLISVSDFKTHLSWSESQIKTMQSIDYEKLRNIQGRLGKCLK